MGLVVRKAKGFARVCKQQGLLKYLIGHIKKPYYRKLQKKYGFDVWHMTPYELRPYAVKIVTYVNEKIVQWGGNCTICEIGCGTGDIIRNIKNCRKKYGFDLSGEVIACARDLDTHTQYVKGGFDIASQILPDKVELLVTVNFIHTISPKELKNCYDHLLSERQINMIIVDVVDDVGYKYHHRFDDILPEYKKNEVIFDYSGRKILVLEHR